MGIRFRATFKNETPLNVVTILNMFYDTMLTVRDHHEAKRRYQAWSDRTDLYDDEADRLYSAAHEGVHGVINDYPTFGFGKCYTALRIARDHIIGDREDMDPMSLNCGDITDKSVMAQIFWLILVMDSNDITGRDLGDVAFKLAQYCDAVSFG